MDLSSEQQADYAEAVTAIIDDIGSTARRLRFHTPVNSPLNRHTAMLAQLIDWIAGDAQEQYDQGDPSFAIHWWLTSILQHLSFGIDNDDPSFDIDNDALSFDVD